jgi:hypothetical protein
VTSLPLDHPGARIAFDVVVGAFVVSELRVRLRSVRNREGARQDQLSVRVVQVTALRRQAAAPRRLVSYLTGERVFV